MRIFHRPSRALAVVSSFAIAMPMGVALVASPASADEGPDLHVFTTSAWVTPEDIATYLTKSGEVSDFERVKGEDGWRVQAAFEWDRSDAGECKYANPKDPFTKGLISIDQFGGNQVANGNKAFYCMLNLEGGDGFKDLDTSNLTDMSKMFEAAWKFNAPIGHFDVSKVSKFDSLFNDAKAFNQPLTDWDTSNATTMFSMFYGALQFNQPVNHFKTSKVTSMGMMFYNAGNFDQPLDAWDVRQVKPPVKPEAPKNDYWKNNGMSAMFFAARNFNQDLSGWDPALFDEEPIANSSDYAFDQGALSWSNEYCNEGRPLFGGLAYKKPCPVAVNLTGANEVVPGEEVTYTVTLNAEQNIPDGILTLTSRDAVVREAQVSGAGSEHTEEFQVTVPKPEVTSAEDLAYPLQAFYNIEDTNGDGTEFESSVLMVQVVPDPQMCAALGREVTVSARTGDIDGDGVANNLDSDIDGDGVPNASDSDIDGDGTPNASDGDIDGDGTPNEGDGEPVGPPARPVPPNFWDEEKQQDLANQIQDHVYGENYPSTFPLPVDPDSGEEETFADGAGVLVPAPSYEAVVEVINYGIDDACGTDNGWDGNAGGSPEKPTDPGSGGGAGSEGPGGGGVPDFEISDEGVEGLPTDKDESFTLTNASGEALLITDLHLSVDGVSCATGCTIPAGGTVIFTVEDDGFSGTLAPTPQEPTAKPNGGSGTPDGAYPILGDGGSANATQGLNLRLITPAEVFQGVETDLTATVDAAEGAVEFGVQEIDLNGNQSVRILGSAPVQDGQASIALSPKAYGDAVIFARYTGRSGVDTTAGTTTVNPAPFIDEFTLRVEGQLWGEMPNGEVLPYGYHEVEYTTDSGNAPRLEVEGPCQVMSTKSIPPQITMLGTAAAPNRCQVTVTTGGYDAYATKSWVFDVANAMGNQSATLAADKVSSSLKVGASKTLAKKGQSVTDEDYKLKGKAITWKVTSGKDVCTVKVSDGGKVTLTGKKTGACTVVANAPKVKGKYRAFSENYTFTVK